MIETRNFPDLGYTVMANVHDYYVEFKVYEIEYFVEGSIKGVYDVPEWHEKGAVTSPSPVPTLEEAEIYLRGSVKWDGCSNWSFDEQERGTMLHGCNRKDLVNIGEIMAKCWDMTVELCPNSMYAMKVVRDES